MTAREEYIERETKKNVSERQTYSYADVAMIEHVADDVTL